MYSHALNEDLTNKEFAAVIDSHGEWDEDENDEIIERALSCGFNMAAVEPETWRRGFEALQEGEVPYWYENPSDLNSIKTRDIFDSLWRYEIDENDKFEDYAKDEIFLDRLRPYIEMVVIESPWGNLYEAALEVLRNSDD